LIAAFAVDSLVITASDPSALPDPAAPVPQETPSGLPPRQAPARLTLRITGVLLLALLACILAYLALTVPGSWFPSAKERGYGPAQLSVTRGSGGILNGELQITAPDAMGFTLVSVVTNFRSSDYAAVQWLVADVPENATVQLLWRSDYTPEKLNSATITIEAGRALPTVLPNNPAWIGRITGLALAIQGPLAHPIRIGGVVAKPMGAIDILRDRAREWFQFERWTGASINAVTGGADVQDLPLPVLVAAAIALAGLMAFGIERWRPGALGVHASLAIGIMFLVGWSILDARWTANLVRQERETARQYAGKDWLARHLAADDAPLFAFIPRARAVLPATPARVFVAADADYFRGRAAYHLYPHSVFFDPRSNQLPAASQLKPGDWLVVFERRGIQYDAARQLLRWDGNQTRAAELKYVEPGGAVFLIR
jgi:hypothetical protein